jgi:hypothetical protein
LAALAPAVVALTLYGPPAVLFAVTEAVATPEALVVAVTVAILAPLAGPVKVTVTPLTGLPPESFTVAISGCANAVLICALWGLPLVAVTVAGEPVLFVRLKLAGAATPGTVALTA